jgi:hypothetical protein
MALRMGRKRDSIVVGHRAVPVLQTKAVQSPMIARHRFAPPEYAQARAVMTAKRTGRKQTSIAVVTPVLVAVPAVRALAQMIVPMVFADRTASVSHRAAMMA